METLTVTVNNRAYELSDDFIESIEQIAENEYGENDFLSYHWRVAGSDEEDHAYGDPILCIETEGQFVPWENLSEFAVDDSIPGVHHPQNNDDTTTHDNGNGVASVPRDSVDAPDEKRDYKMVLFPDTYRPYPDPDDGKLSTIPPNPERFDGEQGPTMIVPIPENTRPERWAAGEAIVPVFTTVEWNLQRRADTVPAYGSYQGGDSHDKWESWLKRCGCAVAGDADSENSENSGEATSIYDERDDVGPKYGPSSQNFRI